MAVVTPSSVLPFDDEYAPLYSVGQVASMLELQQAFLRRLDEFDVVRPRRTDGGQRRYSRVEVGRVQYVVGLTREGMTLAAIRRVLELEQQVKALEGQVETGRRRIRELESRVRSRRASVPPM
ncbi:MerR family transcriptional regulator [Actinomadura barringtoniae]|uniref:MerR family transcriptional regulator n=1 Tax=Actinomadura barringtoniae TaxID=1427535 RepID=A0A939T1E4_9ACTN|nr:MerR family transcriptional regulator [Actinomadura barringtoniae]MBO2447366.1 MerR family transcriptional regulator [Actinomadura barringtoniae]